jgi:ParB-like chromosome segregation protein Spo0J
MIVESIDIALLHLDPANARKHSRPNIEAIKSSLARFGQQKPIVVDSKNVVRAGNGTLVAATELGWTKINIVRTDLAGVEATAFAIADNRTAELAQWDPQTLSALLAEPGIGDLSFDNDELRKLLSQDDDDPTDLKIRESFQVAVDCEDEEEQKEIYERLTGQGYKCRLLTM